MMFFQPRIGLHYHEGFKGYKTLVMGAKHHCILRHCPYYGDCVIGRNCATYNKICPAYGDHHDLRLSQSNQIEIDAFLEEYDRYPTYSYFTKLMLGKTDDCTEAEKTAFWEQVAFANYLQYFCPSPQVPECEEEGLNYRAEDWTAFLELLGGSAARGAYGMESSLENPVGQEDSRRRDSRLVPFRRFPFRDFDHQPLSV